MDNYERSKIADAIKEHDFAKGDKVIQEGDDGSVFFLIISGEAYATKRVNGGEDT
jgi:cAMP-dependent protein kinase regulator